MSDSSLSRKLIVLKRGKVQLLNLPDKFVFLGRRDKVLVISEAIRNWVGDFKKIQVSIPAGHTIYNATHC